MPLSMPASGVASKSIRLESRAIVFRGGSGDMSQFSNAAIVSGAWSAETPSITAAAAGFYVGALSSPFTTTDAGYNTSFTASGLTASTPTDSVLLGVDGIRTAMAYEPLASGAVGGGTLTMVTTGSTAGISLRACAFMISATSFVGSSASGGSRSNNPGSLTLPALAAGDAIIVMVMTRNALGGVVVVPVIPGFQYVGSSAAIPISSTDQYLHFFHKVAVSADSGASVIIARP